MLHPWSPRARTKWRPRSANWQPNTRCRFWKRRRWRALFRHAELGDEIPETLYTAVAEVLAYVFQLKAHTSHGGLRPTPPTALEVPAGMDPNNEQE